MRPGTTGNDSIPPSGENPEMRSLALYQLRMLAAVRCCTQLRGLVNQVLQQLYSGVIETRQSFSAVLFCADMFHVSVMEL